MGRQKYKQKWRDIHTSIEKNGQTNKNCVENMNRQTHCPWYTFPK